MSPSPNFLQRPILTLSPPQGFSVQCCYISKISWKYSALLIYNSISIHYVDKFGLSARLYFQDRNCVYCWTLSPPVLTTAEELCPSTHESSILKSISSLFCLFIYVAIWKHCMIKKQNFLETYLSLYSLVLIVYPVPPQQDERWKDVRQEQ